MENPYHFKVPNMVHKSIKVYNNKEPNQLMVLENYYQNKL